MVLEILTSFFEEAVSETTKFVSGVAADSGSFFGKMVKQGVDMVESGKLYAEAVSAFVAGEAKDMVNPRTWFKEDQNQTIMNNIYASLPGTDYDPLGLENLTSGANNR